VPHLRVENRVLPAGPTVVDVVANAAFFYGAQRALAASRTAGLDADVVPGRRGEPLRGRAHGIDAQLYWPGIGWIPPDELVLRVLLPLAHEGLRRSDVSDEARERYLGVIEQRCLTRRTGSSWQRAYVLKAQESGLERDAALTRMLARYLELSEENEPVHTWSLSLTD
jgi:hypothetical protein